MGGTYLVVALAGCGRIAFDERVDAMSPEDSADAPAGPVALTCNTPVRISAMADPASARVSGVGAPGAMGLVWISDAQKIASAGFSLTAPDTVQLTFVGDGTDLTPTYDLATLGVGAAGLIGVGRNTMGMSEVRVLDPTTLQPVSMTGLVSPFAINTARSVTATGASTGSVFALTGKNGTQSAVIGVTAQNAMGATLNIGNADRLMSVLNVGSRVAILNDSNANNCECRTAPPDLSSVGTPVTYGGGTCDQPVGAYAAGRSDLLFVTHDMTLDRLGHQILTISGATVTLGTAIGLRDMANNARAAANPTNYWTLYTHLGTLEATAIGFTGANGSRFSLGPITDVSAYDVVTAGNDSYALWFANGLNIARLCP